MRQAASALLICLLYGCVPPDMVTSFVHQAVSFVGCGLLVNVSHIVGLQCKSTAPSPMYHLSVMPQYMHHIVVCKHPSSDLCLSLVCCSCLLLQPALIANCEGMHACYTFQLIFFSEEMRVHLMLSFTAYREDCNAPVSLAHAPHAGAPQTFALTCRYA